VTPPEKLTIDTPEQIALEFALAGAGSRFLAIAIDTLVQVGVFLAIALIAATVLWASGTASASIGTWIGAVLIICGFLLYYGYYAGFEALWGGQTPGKRAVGLRVITISGQPITPYDAILRNLLRIVDQLPGIYAVGVLSIFLTARNQRLGDLVAGTVVVSEQTGMAHGVRPIAPSAVRLGAARLSTEELEVIETFLSRRGDLPDSMRALTADKLAARIRRRLEISSVTYGNNEELIERVAAEYRAR